MGWSGYGMYDGDETASTQMSMIEAVGYKKDIPLKNNKSTLDEAMDWNVGKELLSDEVVKKVYKEWDKVEKKVLSKLSKSGFKNEDQAICYLMAADFFLNHKAQMPENLHEQGIDAAKYLKDQGHADEFDRPSERKRILRIFINKMDIFAPTLIFTSNSVEEIIDSYKAMPAKQLNYAKIDENVVNAVKWLFDAENKNTVISNFLPILREDSDITFTQFKQDIAEVGVFPLTRNMGLPKKLTSKLDLEQLTLVQTIVEEQLVDHYRPELISIMKASQALMSAEVELQKAQEQYEKVLPSHTKMKN